jgi:nucleotide-binding universal stress UspA family protein
VPKLFNTILWASDGRADDHQFVHYVGELCDHYCCELRIVHVVQTILPEPMPQLELHEGEERAIAWLKARTRALRLQGVDASLHVIRGVVGSPAPAIVQVAEAVDADLIVLHAGAPWPIGSIGTAARLLATSACPLLLLGSESKPPQARPETDGLWTAVPRIAASHSVASLAHEPRGDPSAAAESAPPLHQTNRGTDGLSRRT